MPTAPAPPPDAGSPRKRGAGAFALAAVALVVLCLLAAPFLVPARFRRLVDAERRAALAALPETPAPAPLRLDPAARDALRRLSVSDLFPFRGLAAHSAAAPLSGEERSALEAWKRAHPEDLALFRAVTDVAGNDPAPPGEPALSADEAQQVERLLLLELCRLGGALLFEAAENGDAGAVEEFDRRLRNLASRFAGDEDALAASCNVQAERLRHFARTLPLCSEAYLDECDRDAERRLRDLPRDLLSAIRGTLSRRDDARLLPVRPESLRPEDVEGAMAANLELANGFRLRAGAPRLFAAFEAALAREGEEDVREAVRAALADARSATVPGWPAVRPLVRDSAAGDGRNAPQRLYAALSAQATFERVAIALERHRRARGDWPDRLEDLDGAPAFRCFPNGAPPIYEKGTFEEAPFGYDWSRPRSETAPDEASSAGVPLRGYRLVVADAALARELTLWSVRRSTGPNVAWLYVGVLDDPSSGSSAVPSLPPPRP